MEFKGRFLDSDDPTLPSEKAPFKALGREGSSLFLGLEVFENPGCAYVTYTSDEVIATCPITGQPDFYKVEISLKASEKLIESKSLKLWFTNLHKQTINEGGLFCEALACYIRDSIAEVTGTDEENVQVVLTQKSRGGISIRALA